MFLVLVLVFFPLGLGGGGFDRTVFGVAYSRAMGLFRLKFLVRSVVYVREFVSQIPTETGVVVGLFRLAILVGCCGLE
jgi:hypothetical protein